MFRSNQKAQQAAVDGEGGEEWDTQKCEAFQEALVSNYSSSRARPISIDASKHNIDDRKDDDDDETGEQSIHDHFATSGAEGESDKAEDLARDKFTHAKKPPSPVTIVDENASFSTNDSRVHRVDLDEAGRLQTYDTDGNIIPGLTVKVIQDGAMEAENSPPMPATEKQTQQTWSPTIPNASQLLGSPDPERFINTEAAVDDLGDGPLHEANAIYNEDSQEKSTRDDSTGFPYKENDTGHVHFNALNFTTAPITQDDGVDEKEQGESQDTSYAPRLDGPVHVNFEPQTPAPLVNPFLNKGSVLKGHEMFGATQSAVGPHFASPTSSRPSPDMQNDLSSPQKRMVSSPLQRYEPPEQPYFQSSARSPLHSTPVNSPNGVPSHRVSGLQSFAAMSTRQKGSLNPEPRNEYIPMHKSQERRVREVVSDAETEDDFADDETVRLRQRRRRVDEFVQKEISAVKSSRSDFTSSGEPERASRAPRGAGRRSKSVQQTPKQVPASISSSGGVEVPSTGRRRSVQEEYLNQCDGFDARDTQQEEIIADSQALSDDKQPEEAKSSPRTRLAQNDPGSGSSAESSAPKAQATPQEPKFSEVDDDSTASESSQGNPNLPLQEVSSNRNDSRTPVAPKPTIFSDGPNSTVPETSPPEDRIRPLSEVASFFEPIVDEALENIPGFTPDKDFNRAMGLNITPTPSRKSLRFKATTTPIVGFNLPKAMNETSSSEQRSEERVTTAVGFAVDEPNQEHEIDTEGDGTTRIQSKGSEATEDPPVAENRPLAKELDSSKAADLPVSNKRDLRSKEELRGPSKDLRRVESDNFKLPASTPQRSMRTPKSTPKAPDDTSRSSRRPSTGSVIASTASSPLSSAPTSLPSSSILSGRSLRSAKKEVGQKTPDALIAKKALKRKTSTAIIDDVAPTRSSKRHPSRLSTEESEDPLCAASTSHPLGVPKGKKGLFSAMSFAVSYVKQSKEKDEVGNAIAHHGGRILEKGFDELFGSGATPAKSRAHSGITTEALTLSNVARKSGFTALIADEHSRKAKYMQALALGLPCISYKWISACVTKGSLIDWAPYLLCAGQSSFLANAIRSRVLQPYPADDASFTETFAARQKLLEGRSILLVGEKSEKRDAYTFLTRALGPSNISRVVDFDQARKRLLEAEAQDQGFDWLYVDNEEAAKRAIFEPQATGGAVGSRKRKRGPTAVNDDHSPPPKRIRIIDDEFIIQSLILGQLIDD